MGPCAWSQGVCGYEGEFLNSINPKMKFKKQISKIMKKRLFLMLLCVCTASVVFAKDWRVVVFKVEQMTCANCEQKIKNNIRFEKGLKELSTHLEEKTVTITYDPEKTDVEKLRKGFGKIKYEAVVLEDKVKETNKR